MVCLYIYTVGDKRMTADEMRLILQSFLTTAQTTTRCRICFKIYLICIFTVLVRLIAVCRGHI